MIGHLHVLTNTTMQSKYTHIELAQMAIDGGCDTIQLRDKHLSDDDFFEVATRVYAECAAANVSLIVNDRIDIARELGSVGLHLGTTDLPIKSARVVLGPRAVIGASAGSLAEAQAAEDAGADYVGFGHMFPTKSKLKETPPVGLDMLRVVCESISIPVIAIGGVTSESVDDLLEAGAHGIAVIGAVCNAPSPRSATIELATKLGLYT